MTDNGEHTISTVTSGTAGADSSPSSESDSDSGPRVGMSLSKQKQILDAADSDGVASSEEFDGGSPLLLAKNMAVMGDGAEEAEADEHFQEEAASSDDAGVIHGVDVVRNPAASEITGQRDVQSIEDRLVSIFFDR